MSDPNIKIFGKDRLVCIGKILGLHGFKGALKLQSYVESVGFFEPETQVWLRNRDGKFFCLTIDRIKPHKKGFLLFFKEACSTDECEKLINAELFVNRHHLPETETGTYYWVDLIGLSVYTMEDLFIGRLEHIFFTGSNDVYVVKNGKTEVLVPALESVVKRVSLADSTMHVELPEGL